MARSFNEKMEKKRQAEYNPVWHRRNHWLLKYEEDSTWEDSRAYDVELGCDLKGYVETAPISKCDWSAHGKQSPW